MIASNLLEVFLFSFIWPTAWLPFGIFLAFLLGWKPFQPLSLSQKLFFVLSLYAIAPLALAGILFLFDLPWLSIGLSVENIQSGSFFVGLILSTASIAGLFGLFLGLGWINVQPIQNFQSSPADPVKDTSSEFNAPSPLLHPTLLVFPLFILGIIIGGVEELVFRGFLTGRLCESWAVWLAGAIASLIFALLHLVWEGKDNIPQLPGLWVMGIVLTIAWWVDHQAIALAWGLHAGWVWSIATLDSLELIQYTKTVPDWVTGVDNKPLAGVMGVGALAITGLALMFFFNG